MYTNDTIGYIKQLAQDLAGCNPDYTVLSILLDMTVPVNFKGFEYLQAAILMQYERSTRDLVNDIYRMLAKDYGISEEMIASTIRGAISAAWNRGDKNIWFRYLPTIPRDRSSAPTNAEVIAGLARILQLWRGCSEAYMRQQCKEVVSSGRE